MDWCTERIAQTESAGFLNVLSVEPILGLLGCNWAMNLGKSPCRGKAPEIWFGVLEGLFEYISTIPDQSSQVHMFYHFLTWIIGKFGNQWNIFDTVLGFLPRFLTDWFRQRLVYLREMFTGKKKTCWVGKFVVSCRFSLKPIHLTWCNYCNLVGVQFLDTLIWHRYA